MQYRPAVDVARLISAFLIVLFHAADTPYKRIAESGLAYFVLLTFCLQGMGTAGRRSFSARKRAIRLLGPWVVWSVFYGFILLARQRHPLEDLLAHPGDLLVGPEIHLWFLPFAFLGGLFAQALLELVDRLPATWGLFILCLSSVALAACGPPLSEMVVRPFGQWLYALPLLPLGLAVGLAQQSSRERLALHYVVILAVTIAIARQYGLDTYVLGVVGLGVSMLPRSREYPRLKWLAGLSMGIYLIHPFMFLCVHKLYVGASWVDHVTIGFFGAAVASGLLMLSPFLSSFLFGVAGPSGIPGRRAGLARIAILPGSSIPAPRAEKLSL